MSINYKNLAIEIGYSYLNGQYGYWEDNSGEMHSYDSMDSEYIKNCINFIDRGINEINNNENGIINEIEKYLGKIIKEPNKNDVKYAKEQIIKMLKEKRLELKEYNKIRKSF